MTDLNRMRRLAGLKISESISDHPELNTEIERKLASHPAEEQTRLLDALDALKMAGANGLSVPEWAAKFRELHPEADVGSSLKMAAKEFQFCVKRVGDKKYAFVDEKPTTGDIDPRVAQGVRDQVGMTFAAMNVMQEMGEFSRDDLVNRLSRMMPPQMADQYADHVLNVFHGALQKLPGGRYRLKDEDQPNTSEDSMNLLRDLAKRAGGEGPAA